MIVVPVGWLENAEAAVNCDATEGELVVSEPGLFESRDQLLLKLNDEATLDIAEVSVEVEGACDRGPVEDCGPRCVEGDWVACCEPMNDPFPNAPDASSWSVGAFGTGGGSC